MTVITLVAFEHFSVTENFACLFQGKRPTTVTSLPYTMFWDGSEPKVGVDRDGIPILIYLPELFSEKDNVSVLSKSMMLF